MSITEVMLISALCLAVIGAVVAVMEGTET